MSWIGFYSLSAVGFLGLLIPLILFYFLKLRRPQVRISSLVLWQQVLNDQRVNSPFQRFRRNLLLLLQILMLVSLVLALMQPYLPSGAARVRYLPILIDNSASMGALNNPDGKTRLEEAKERVHQLIDHLLPDQRVCLIEMSSSARTLVDFTDNRKLLHTALDQLTVKPTGSHPEDALRMAQALGRSSPVNRVVLFSDGNLPQRIDLELPFQVDFQKLDAGGANLGIAEINARRNRTGWEVFVRVESGSIGSTSGVLELIVNNQKQGEAKVSLDPNNGERIEFVVATTEPASVECRIRPDGFDALDLDNAAFLELPAQRPLLVSCSKELTTFRRALKAFPDIQISDATAPVSQESAVDLLITDQVPPVGSAARVTLNIGVVPQDLTGMVSIQTEIAEVIDWQRNAPLLLHVDLNEVQISDQTVSAPQVTEKEFEKLGYEVLAHGKRGPLILVKDREGLLDYHLLFHTDRSTLPYRVGFPILVSNLVGEALDRAGLSEIKGTTTGTLPSRQVEANRQFEIISPNGERLSTQSGEDGFLSGIAASQTGRYRIEEQGGRTVSVGISLIQSLETSLKSIEELQFSELKVESASQLLKSDTPLWSWLVLAGLLLLLLEWWYFHGRPVASL